MNRKRFTPGDIHLINTLNSVQVTEDGQTFVVSLTSRDSTANAFLDHIVRLDSQGNERLRIEGSSPLLAPNTNFIAFERDSRLCVYDITTSTTKDLAHLYPTDYFMGHMADQNFAWAPDSSCIAFVSAHQHAHTETSVVVIDRLLYKTKGGRGRPKFTSGAPCHIWIAPLSGETAYCITDGEFNEHSISWSPDGNHIAFISNRSSDPDTTHTNDLFKVNVHTREIQPILSGTGTRFKPSWSPRGDLIAFLADESDFTSKDSPAPDHHLYTITTEGTNVTCHTRSLDRRIDNISWSPRGEKIFFTAGDRGTTALYSVTISESLPVIIAGESSLTKTYWPFNNDRQFALIRNSDDAPDEFFIYNQLTKQTVQLTSFNAAAKASYKFAAAESFWCKSSDGTSIQGWLLKPFNFNPALRYPCVLTIHGGPHNMYGYEFDEKMQVLSSAGYAVVFVNPRGSSGYGQAFTNGNLLNWGGKDYDDLTAAVDHVIATNRWIDENRLGVTGQSYGGFMTNWIITQTNRFKAAVSEGGISNLVSFAGTSLYHCLIEAEFNGSTWNNYDLLWNWSPLKYIQNVSTPTLFLHGETDNEVPVTQAEEMFSALKRLGVESEFVRYQNEGHGWRPDLLPNNRTDLYERMITWLNRFLNPEQ